MNILGIWDGHDSGAALLQDGQLRFAVNEERLSRRKLEISFPARSIDASLAHAGLRPEQIDVVAATTSDPAKTLGRLWPGSKERYYAVRRRKAPLWRVSRALKYRLTEAAWRCPGPSAAALRRQTARPRARDAPASIPERTRLRRRGPSASRGAWC
jgi:carbamoyltransferase